MKRIAVIYAAVILNAVLVCLMHVSCDRCGTEPEQEERVYGYAASDSAGTRVAEGVLYLTRIDSLVLGHWRIKKVGSSDAIGPQTGSGSLEGIWTGNTIWVELRPEWRDNNVMLTGTISASSFNGIWIYSSFVGITASGTFTAPRIMMMDCLR